MGAIAPQAHSPMASSRISSQARRFLSDHIHSVLQLELLLMIRDAPTGRTARDASRELRARSRWVESQLRDFAGRDVVTCDDASPVVYTFAAQGRHADAVAEIADTYRRRRTTIIKLIYAPASHHSRPVAEGLPPSDEDAD